MNTVFIAGHSRLPSGMAAKSIYETLTITAEIDKKYGVIVALNCTLATEHGRDFIQRLLRGYSLNEELLNAKTNVKTSGGYSGNTGAMGVKKPYLIIKNTLTSMPDNYNKYIGNAYNDIKNISECVGYSVIENVQLIGEMTDTEKEEIKNYLESGVII